MVLGIRRVTVVAIALLVLGAPLVTDGHVPVAQAEPSAGLGKIPIVRGTRASKAPKTPKANDDQISGPFSACLAERYAELAKRRKEIAALHPEGTREFDREYQRVKRTLVGDAALEAAKCAR